MSMLLTLGFVATWLIVIADVYRTDKRFVRGGMKWAWMIFVITLPIIGAIAWFLFGRPTIPVRRDGRPASRVVGPEDTPEWAAYVGGAPRSGPR